MITLNLSGALGNQMFEYAYARALSEEFGDKTIVINPYFSLLYNIAATRTFHATPNELTCLKLNNNVQEITSTKGTVIGGYDFIKFAFDRVFMSNSFSPEVYMKRSAKGAFQISNFGISYFEHNASAPQHKVVTGLFQSEKYFSKIRPILLDEFQVKPKPSNESIRMIDEISSCNSVCVHIRRGDYLNSQFSYLQVCNEAYYKRAIKYIADHVESPVFYIFSNGHRDLEWIKNNYCFDQSIKYVDLNNPGYEDLRLMYNCKHFIISNSTFSWWGSYLSQSSDKIVCAPSQWFANVSSQFQVRPYPGRIDIYRDDMVKIPVDLEEEQL